MNRVDFSEFVKDDIDEIWSYIAIDDLENADRFIDTFAPIYKLLAGIVT